jgi:hypothetical protein
MKNPTIDNWKKVTHSSVSISVVFSLIFGMVGYLTFNSLTQGKYIKRKVSMFN